MFGIVFFTILLYGMMRIHYMYAKDNYIEESGIEILLFLGMIALYPCYILTLIIMRTRHAGKVCSGDYIGDHWLNKNQDATYI